MSFYVSEDIIGFVSVINDIFAATLYKIPHQEYLLSIIFARSVLWNEKYGIGYKEVENGAVTIYGPWPASTTEYFHFGMLFKLYHAVICDQEFLAAYIFYDYFIIPAWLKTKDGKQGQSRNSNKAFFVIRVSELIQECLLEYLFYQLLIYFVLFYFDFSSHWISTLGSWGHQSIRKDGLSLVLPAARLELIFLWSKVRERPTHETIAAYKPQL